MEKIELPKECENLILSIFKRYKTGEALTESTEDSISTVERWINKAMSENQILMDKIHDILVQLKEIEPNDKEILEIIKEIPKEILSIGISWGYSDTVFGDEVYVWIRDNKL